MTQTIPQTGYEWTCPFCGAARLNRSSSESGQGNAEGALRNHILFSNGVEHGPRYAYPNGDSAIRLSDHVVRVDEAAVKR